MAGMREAQGCVNCRLFDLRAPDRSHVRTEPDFTGLRQVLHVAHDTAAGRDGGHREEILAGRIEADEPVGIDTRFDEPDPVLAIDGEGVILLIILYSSLCFGSKFSIGCYF